ncbi:MAG TPA: radical SAM protein [Acidimicrobiales bacterium]|nr:radical SAM protein [Acidimicrobiales bacterium]
MTTALVVSTYELGARPLGITTVAGALRAAGHTVLTCDLSVEEWPEEALARADCLCCSVPMHTALRLGAEAARRARAERPALPVYFFGLYAKVAEAAGLLEPGDAAVEADEAAALVGLCDALAGATVRAPAPPAPADHRGLPPLARYARFVTGDEERLVATVASTTGCNHHCRHCPVPLVHRGRSQPLALAPLVEEVGLLVDEGARHVHFADPDFLNRPRHAARVVGAIHAEHPALTFDATVKVSHILRFGGLLGELAAAGLVTVTSAFESTSDRVLERLDKGHCAADLHRCVELLRQVGIEPRPSLLPFTPWTERRDLTELLDFVASHDLVDNVDPVQYSIRLLLPPGSLLLGRDDATLDAALEGAAPGAIGIAWHAADPLLDELAGAIAARVELAATAGEAQAATYGAVRALVYGALSEEDPGLPPLEVPAGPPVERRGRLDESWFCCAEPTLEQLSRLHAAEPIFLGLGIPTGHPAG